MTKPWTITINNQAVRPGERTTIMLPMPKLYDWTSLSMPVHIINGDQPGPTLCVTAAIHGDEVNGIEIVRRLMKETLLKKIAGTLIAVPIVNVYGFLYQDRYLMDRRDLNRSFPGSVKGSLAGRLAHLLVSELLSKSTHAIDLHAGSLHRTNLPQIRANLDDPQVVTLAKAFNVPLILHASLRDGSMRQYASDENVPCLLYEAGESLRFDEISITAGLQGVLNVMHALKMITLKKLPKKITPKLSRSSIWIRAQHSGTLQAFIDLGDTVKKGQVLAIIANPTSHEEHPVKSTRAGIIIGKNNLPLVHEGAALFHIAS